MQTLTFWGAIFHDTDTARSALFDSVDRFVKAFRRNPDGSWTCIEPATDEGPYGRIQVTPGSTFFPGTKFMNVDLVYLLDELCQDTRKAS